MSGFFQNLLQDTTAQVKNAGTAFFGNDYLRDYTHASKTFVANSYGYAPKFKFLFHVYFNINKDLIAATNRFPEDQNFGLAVKTVQLPKFSFELATMNQYNRKRVVQTKIKYDPITITFHDDHSNLIRKMWHTYYTYYYKDAAQTDPSPGSTSSRNIYTQTTTNDHDWGYIGEGSGTSADKPTPSGAALGATKAPFFKSIDVFGFSQHNFSLYRLVNPIIESFQHDTHSYAEGSGVMENTMSLQYETVNYYEGALDGRTPDQTVSMFGRQDHYDRTVSPIAKPGSQATILGQGGLVDAAGGILNDANEDPPNFLGIIQKVGQTAQTFKNPQNVLNIAKGEAISMATSAITGTPNRNTIFNFPAAASTVVKSTNSTIGSAIKAVNPTK
jgi:peptide deformylase